jgi:site-specific DNA-cytosine methylase
VGYPLSLGSPGEQQRGLIAAAGRFGWSARRDRARAAWRLLGVDGLGVADDAPGPAFPADRLPKLTTRMVARIQGFPDTWVFSGGKTAAYRQIGNAFPPPVAASLGAAIGSSLTGGRRLTSRA